MAEAKPRAKSPRVVGSGGRQVRDNREERDEFAAEVGERLFWVREQAGLSQTEMVRLIETVSQPQYARWETGSNLADVYGMLRFCARMRVSMDYLYRGSLIGVHPDLAAKLLAAHPKLRSSTGTDMKAAVAVLSHPDNGLDAL